MNKEKDLETVIVLALASLIIYIKFDANWGIYLAMGFLALAIISKKAINILSKIWFSFSNYLGLVMNYVIMFLIFYLILTPLSFFQRLLGKNQFHNEKKENSYFHKCNHLYGINDIEKPW